MKTYDIFLGRCSSWYALRVAQNASEDVLAQWLAKGYRVETEHQIGVRLHEIYLVQTK